MERWLELKEKGYKNLVGEERKEYQVLKAKYGKVVNHVVTEQDLVDNKDLALQGVKVGDMITIEAEEPETKETKEELKTPEKTFTGDYVMLRNVLHDDVLYKEGETVNPSEKVKVEFLEKKFMREKFIH